ncbi:MAG: anti-sigma factor antagonist [Clostridia bacterium]|nr:anti-sigma factor antagonist [Clostridia bacterium]
MEITISRADNILIIKITGELDHHCADSVRQRIDRELMKIQTRYVIFDFSELSFMDSSGIGMLMGRYKTVKHLGGRAGIVLGSSAEHDRYGMPMPSSIERILDMSGVFKCMQRYDDIYSAVVQIGG